MQKISQISYNPVLKSHTNIRLPLSKSESNRGIAILYLLSELQAIKEIEWSDSTDTQLLLEFLLSETEVFNFEDAGTPLRFALAIQTINPEFRTITGNLRLRQRPIGDLLDALKLMGAEIEFLVNENQIPLRIKGPINPPNIIEISGKESSQHVSAIMILIATKFKGHILKIIDELVSPSYVDLTADSLKKFGIDSVKWQEGYTFHKPQVIRTDNFKVYGDWSAAGYCYLLQLMLPQIRISLSNLDEESAQGDVTTWRLFEKLGIETIFLEGNAYLKNTQKSHLSFDEDFHSHPDLVPTFVSACAYLGIEGIFRNIEILRNKESDRIATLNMNLQQLGFELKAIEPGTYKLVKTKSKKVPFTIQTENDHRIAMAFAPWTVPLENISIDNPNCVSKSFPKFWEEIEKCGIATNLLTP